MKKHLNIIYVIIIAGLALFATRIQIGSQMKAVNQALENQDAAVQSLRSDINTIASFLNERTNVRVQVSAQEAQEGTDGAEGTGE